MNSILPSTAPLTGALGIIDRLPPGMGEAMLTLAMLAMAAAVIRADMRDLEIDARLVVALALGGLALGLVAPVAPLTPAGVALGAVVGLGLGGLARGYAWLRTGLPAFGGADILLLGGIGGSLGAVWLGGVTALAAAVAVALARIGPPSLAERAYPDQPALEISLGTSTKTDCIPSTSAPRGTKHVRVLPFCPALIIAWAIAWSLVRTGGV